MEEALDLGNTAVTTYRLEGRIVDNATGHGVADVYVEFWDQEGICKDLVGVARTDTLGDFSIALQSTYLDTILLDRRPPLAFRLFKEGQFDPPSVTWQLSHETARLRIGVNPLAERTTAQPSNFVVRGRLSDASGSPMQNRVVRAYDKGLNGEVILRRTPTALDEQTDEQGRYRISYPTTALGRSGKLHADLVVRAFDPSDEMSLIVESGEICRAPTTAIVDLVPENARLRGMSEYDRLQGLVISVISDGEITSLNEDKISYIACTTGEPRDHIALLVEAAKLAAEMGTQTVLVYALLRQDLPATRRGLLAQRPATLRDAIARSMGQNIVSTASPDDIDRAMEELVGKMVDLAFEPRVSGGGCLGDIVATALSDADDVRKFVGAVIEHEGTIAEFWTALAAIPTFSGAGTVDRLKRAMQWGALTRYHRPLVEELEHRFGTGLLTSLRDLAKYNETDWGIILGDLGVSCPPDTPGADETAQRANYVGILARTVETAFPTAVIADRMTRDEGDTADISVFFANNPDLELGATRVASYLERTSGAMTGVADAAATTQKLKGIERIFRITPRYREMKELLSAGLHSAQSIHRMGKSRFIAKFSSGEIGAAKAEQIYDKASWIASAATALLGKYGSGVNGPLVHALPDLVTPAGSPHQDIADFATLFGTLDGCACEHCRSVYGPAAYLVDLLEFLDHHDSVHETADSTPENQKFYTARDVLLGDLGGPSGGPVARRPDIARIGLSCENTNTALPYIDLVNEILEVSVANVAADPDQVWPATIDSSWTSVELLAEPQVVHPEARHAAYVALSNEVFPFVLPFHLWTEEARIYLDHLGVSRHELLEALVAAKKTPPGDIDDVIARERLRMSKREWEVLTKTNSPPTTAACWGVANISVLVDVPTFLKQAGISFDELRELLSTAYVNPSADPVAVELDPEEGCDIESKTLSGLDDTTLGRIHRFLRLRKRIGVSITELDQVMSALDATDTSEALLRNVADVLALREKFALPLPVLLSFWGPLGSRTTEWATPIYDTLFVDKSVPYPNPFVQFPAETTVIGNAAGVLAGLRINALELGILAIPEVALTLTGSTSALPAGALLSVDNLSRLHRIVTLSRALGLGIRDFWVLHSLAGMNALLDDASLEATPATTRAFVELVEKVRRSKFTIAELSYLVRHVALPGTSVGRSDEEVTALVASIGAGIAEIVAARSASLEPTDVLARAELLEKDVAGFVKQKLATEFGLDAKIVAYLLEHALLAFSNDTSHAIADFLPASAPAPTPANQEDTVKLLEKVALLVDRLGFSAPEIEALFPNATSTAWLALGELPLAVDNDEATYHARFVELMRLVELAAVRDALPGKGETLLAIFGAGSMSALYGELASRTSWAKADIEDWAVFTYQPDDPEISDFRDEKFITRLQRAFALLNRLGASAKQAFFWTNIDAPLPPVPPPPDAPPADPPLPPNAADIALDIKRVARAKYDDVQWTAVARPLRNVLREKQRDALVGYLVAKGDLDGPDALFERLLVDVEMSACQLTSRIKQAIGSVQTFVQRALLRLEADDVVLGEDAAHEWEWMKSYRVWEANRKVFLYPENWIEPELRDDKTPFFKTFESRLLQGEITADAAEGAYREYLENLHEVARLEIAALHHEKETGDDAVDIVHVIARTAAAPQQYFYRRRVDSRYWTPWEKVDLDIQGDHLLATVWNRRLYLFWPVFEQRTVDDQERTVINLAWSHLGSEGFAAVKTTRDDTLYMGTTADHRWLSFSASREGDALRIDCLWTMKGPKFRRAGVYLLDPCTGEMEVSEGDDSSFAAWAPRDARPEFMYLEELTNDDKKIVHDEGYDKLTMHMPKNVPLLDTTPNRFAVHLDRSDYNLHRHTSGRDVLFFADRTRTFFLDSHSRYTSAWKDVAHAFPNVPAPIGQDAAGGLEPIMLDWAHAVKLDFDTDFAIEGLYRFHNFYHPYVCNFVRNLERDGIDGLLRWSTQGAEPLQNALRDIEDEYDPTVSVAKPFPIEDVDFSYRGAYSQYNWELFFHAPFLIATRLSKNSRFDEADRWFRYIFDPTGGAPGTGAERFWNVRPFRENIDLASIQEQLEVLSAENPNAEVLQDLFSAAFESGGTQDIAAQIALWRDNPFNPHLIARMRPLAYQKSVVMKYVENLIAWGDSLFRRETIEAINEATQLYILAGQILGDRPQLLKERNVPRKTYAELEPLVDAFSNALVEIESIVPAPPSGGLRTTRREPHPVLRTLYFCVPQNEKMLGLWDTVADRLFKVRHCMNIDGTVRQLPLFEPPIDPALLVKAAAAGIDFGSLLSNVNAALPIYRFSVLQSKAMEFAGSVVAMGGALLSALEKRDGEALSRMRAGHESDMLAAVRAVRKRQIDEAKESLEAVRRSRAVVEERRRFYAEIEPRIAEERAQQDLTVQASVATYLAQSSQLLAAELKIIPQFILNISPATEFGGEQLAGVAELGGQFFGMLAAQLSTSASMAGTEAGYRRRAAEWTLQKDLAEKELAQFDRQIAAAEIRLELAKKELSNHDISIKNAKEVEDHLRTKYTNAELYEWIASQVKDVYFQGYKLAFEMARRAEKAFQFELAQDTSYVVFGYWDSAKQGLLAGEKLQHDLRRMEAAYLEQNKREYEITKHISLAEVDPEALLKLREEGNCCLELPEWLFDMDWPGHYLRRIKSVSVTVPVVNGPYVGVNCKLTLVNSTIRMTSALDSTTGYLRKTSPSEGLPRFLDYYGAMQSIVTSTGQNDAGLFELAFRDERYLPFEGAGTNGSWTIELKKESNRFHPKVVHDVVLHVRYTARDGGDTLKSHASNNLATDDAATTGQRLFSAKTDFPEAWHQFAGSESESAETLSLALVPRLFQPLRDKLDLQITKVRIFARRKDGGTSPLGITVAAPYGDPSSSTLTVFHGSLLSHDFGPMAVDILDESSPLTMTLVPQSLEDIWVICEYQKKP